MRHIKKLRLWTFTLLWLSFIFLPIGIASDVPFADVPFDINNIPEPVPPPKEVRDFFDLDPFYEQWINVQGFPVVSSSKVNPYALKEAAWLIWQIIGHRPDVLEAMAKNRGSFSVIAHTELIMEIPEYRNYGGGFLNCGFRGFGGPPVSASEENLLHYPGGGGWYSVMIHEFGHAIHLFGVNTTDPTFDNRLKSAYGAAIAKGLWAGTYASSDRREYWAEGTQTWFYPQGFSSFSGISNTRQALKTYDPALASLLSEVYGDTQWRYTPPAVRTHLPHLQEFNPQDSPTYQGFPELEELKRQFNDPNSDGGDNWVDLRPYDPSLLPDLSRKRTDSNLSQGFRLSEGIGFLNVTQSRILVYEVDYNDREHYWTIVNPNDLRVHGGRINDIWLIKDDNGTDLMLFQSQSKLGRAIIGGGPLITPGLSKYAGDNQSGVSGTALSSPFVVEVRDENGLSLEGISITFAVVAGDGTLDITDTTTDENGRADSSFTLGRRIGTNTVFVSAVGIENTVTFNAVAAPAINIPDPNLRAVVETALGKRAGEPIASGEMLALTHLKANNANISDLTGLEHATNLTRLVLEGEPDATGDWHNSNSVSDLSPLRGLTHLAVLELWNNSVSDLSPLAGLVSLQNLGLVLNNVSDLSPLVANTGLATGDAVWLAGNPLNYQSLYTYIPALQSRGVSVQFDAGVTRPPDVNGDGVVNVLDLIRIAQDFGTAKGDLNGDGTTDILDLMLVSQAFRIE